MRSEWAPRTAFAEVAEALGVATDEVMAAVRRGDRVFVLYSTDTSDLDSALVHEAILEPDADGVLRRTVYRTQGSLRGWLRAAGLEPSE